MFLVKIVFAVFTCTGVTNYIVAGQDDIIADELEELPEEETTPAPIDNHTFVALIDIVFTDGKKRTCTGTIIHDNVVITAAHCFVDHRVYIEAELTASFVVIGTKKMYDTGYENYLPIERVITHPNYRGWTADIALVYTFAGMTSDKPGNIMPLIGESALTPVDSNVTILSWGRCKDEVAPALTRAPSTDGEKRTCDSTEDNNDSCEVTTAYAPPPLRIGAAVSSTEIEPSSDQESLQNQFVQETTVTTKKRIVERATSRFGYAKAPRAQRFTAGKRLNDEEDHTAVLSRYLKSSEKKSTKEKVTPPPPPITQKHRYVKANRNSSHSDHNVMVLVNQHEMAFRVHNDRVRRSAVGLNFAELNKTASKVPKRTKDRLTEEVQDARRNVDKQENKLVIEIFGFVNVQTCKKLVDKAMPEMFSINTNEVVCYASEDHYISDDDSGAPAVRQGHLVAVTLGGVECEGEHVAVGIKMSCYCSWIAENLPSGGGNDMHCCKDCCGAKGKEDATTTPIGRHRNKYLYKK